MTGDLVTDGHLGGYVAGGDPDTTYPELWRWLVQEQGIRSVIDIGCGDGAAVDFFDALGVTAFGIDGMPQSNPLVATHDFTAGPIFPTGRFDLAWSCEFVEHVEEPYICNFMAAFQSAELALMTHALPGQPGWHHVNCQPSDYWFGVFASYEFVLDATLTGQARRLAALNPSPSNYFARTGLAFRRSS